MGDKERYPRLVTAPRDDRKIVVAVCSAIDREVPRGSVHITVVALPDGSDPIVAANTSDREGLARILRAALRAMEGDG